VVAGDQRYTMIILVSGRFRLELTPGATVLDRQGDYVVWGPGIDHSWQAEADSVVITVGWPSRTEGWLGQLGRRPHVHPARTLAWGGLESLSGTARLARWQRSYGSMNTPPPAPVTSEGLPAVRRGGPGAVRRARSASAGGS
jgi:hypothetical protein